MSPFEVERQEFGRGPWGYKRSEVNTFLDEVQTTLVGLWQERSQLREENERLNERVARFTALEEQLKNTLLLAQDSAEKACEQARREAELIMREAGQKAREIVHTAHEERQRLETTLRDLQSSEVELRQRFRGLANTVLSHLNENADAVADTGTILRATIQEGIANNRPAESTFDTPPTFDKNLRAERKDSETSAPETSEKEPVGAK
jgi:cell division initiation protein